MPRLHSGGFINQEFYFNIGTEDARGRDGDTARTAAKKYNDHRHSPFLAISADSMRNWINELKDVSEDPVSGNVGGVIEQESALLRLSGDTAELNSVVYMMTNAGVRPVTSGFGPHIDLPADSTQDPEVVADFICSNFLMFRRDVSDSPIPCRTGVDAQGQHVPISLTVGECVVYPTARAGSGEIFTQVGVTAAVRVVAPPVLDLATNNGNLYRKPVIGVSLKVKRFDYNPITQRILSTVSIPSQPTLITSMTGGSFDSVSNSDDRGLTLATLLDESTHFVGKVELEMKFDVDACYTVDDFINEAGDHAISVPELKSALCAWANDNVELELVDATARIVCRFGGE